MVRFLTVIAFSTVFSFAAGASAQDRFAVGVYGGTLGVGGDVQFRATDRLVLRAGGHFLEFNIDGNYDGVDYDADVNGSNFFATLDVHPFANGWFVSGGVVLGDKSVDLVGAPDGPVEIGDLVFTPDQVGDLIGRADVNSAAPFVGLGWDNAVTSDGRVGFSILLGAAFTGDPDVDLTSEGGLLSDQPLFQEQLAIEEENLRDELDDFSVYPVGRIGLTVSF
ncbi:MAG: hypothetical protein AAGD92_03190 [Pseudomonadota bacterium]